MKARNTNCPVPDLRTLAGEGSVHFMGVGGAGMCALAELFLSRGGSVTGCDLKDSQSIQDLSALGVQLSVGHDPRHVTNASALVVTSAVPSDHPELVAARDRGIPVLKRAEALGAWVNQGKVIAISGTHGKTTTTAMATEILAQGGLDPTGIVGGRVRGWAGNLRRGSDHLFVVEADEYDRSFHMLTPDIAIVTNVEADHLDVYGDYQGVRAGFEEFLDNLKASGKVIACADDHGSASLLTRCGGLGYSYGTTAGSMLRAIDVSVTEASTNCSVIEEGALVGELSLSMNGVHNLRNALGAAAVARKLDVPWPIIFTALSEFKGVGRRLERLGERCEVIVLDDYAHHPSEIRAALDTARKMYTSARLIAVFQPHLFSRTRDFAEDFGAALAEADSVWVTDIFPARENPIPGVTGGTVVEAVRRAGGGHVCYVPALGDLPNLLAEELRAGDVLVTLGAGSIDSLGGQVLDRLGERVHA